MRSTLLFALLFMVMVAAFSAAPALAGGGCHDGAWVVGHIFDKADADADGMLSPTEYEDANLGRFGASFEDTDADGDGMTSRSEYIELYERIHKSPEELSV